MEVLKISTAGSVDDGKSTLIGRLLYDTGSLTEDKLHSIEAASKQRGMDYIDYSLATDGLLAEREQGITIDVAHIYLSTPKRNYIIADTPGHKEFTRNMVTGASTSQLSIVLIDARKGVLDQTMRHICINRLLRIKKIIIAVNKMDLVEYSMDVFESIKEILQSRFQHEVHGTQEIQFIPLCALSGENVVHRSGNMGWYTGPSLLQALEEISLVHTSEEGSTRFPVQMAIRPNIKNYMDFRGYAGKVIGNSLSVGDKVTVLPTLKRSTIKEIRMYRDVLAEVPAGSSVLVTLEDDLQLNRGDMLAKTTEVPDIKKEIAATLCWLDTQPLLSGGKYLLQHHSNLVLCKISAIESVLDADLLGKRVLGTKLQLNDIGSVDIKLSRPIYCDPYKENKANGAFILIDPQTNATAALGFIE